MRLAAAGSAAAAAPPESRPCVPRVSVVIVGYESREALGPCLASLERCRAALELECILVDNASSDGTVAWARAAHPWVRVIASAENLGFTRGVNRGAAAARGELLFILNPDCEVGADAVIALTDAAQRPGVAAVAPALRGADGARARSCGRFPGAWSLICDHLGLARAFPGSRWFGAYKYGGVPPESLDRVDWASGAALMIPRRAWERVGGLDERIFMYMEEVDWCRRAAALGLAVRHLPHAEILHVGQLSAARAPTATYLHNLRSRIYYYRKHHGALAALFAKAVLGASLALKWTITRPRAGSAPAARIYAAGLGAVWAA